MTNWAIIKICQIRKSIDAGKSIFQQMGKIQRLKEPHIMRPRFSWFNIFIGHESDHCLSLSVSLDLIYVTLADDDAFSKVADIEKLVLRKDWEMADIDMNRYCQENHLNIDPP